MAIRVVEPTVTSPVASLAISAGTTSQSSGTVVFSNSNGISFGMNGSTITASFNPMGASGILSISGGTTFATGPGVSFADGNGVTFGVNGNTITASVSPSGAGGLTALSAGTTFATGPGVVLSNSNGLSFGANGNTITGAYQAIQSISAGTTQVTTGQVVFSDGNGVSFGANGQTITASVAPQSAQPITVFSQWGEFGTNFTAQHGLASFQKVSIPMAVSGASGAVILDLVGNSNSSGGLSMVVGAYRLTQSTIGNLTSKSMGFSWTSGSDTTASSIYGGVSGTRYRSFLWDVSMTPGDYVFAFVISTENDGTCRALGRQGVSIVGSFVGFETNYFVDGHTNSTVAALPAAVAANNTNYVRTGLSALRQPGFILFGTN